MSKEEFDGRATMEGQNVGGPQKSKKHITIEEENLDGSQRFSDKNSQDF